jgi:hypothetical protein
VRTATSGALPPHVQEALRALEAGETKARFDADTQVPLDQPLDVGIRPDKMHFFDLETGARIG